MDNEEIFTFINPDSNDYLSNMNGNDLQELIILLNHYYLQLRSILGLNKNITFGLELEFENAKHINKIYNEIDNNSKFNNKWIIKCDGSLIDGAEVNSPILTDNENTWQNLDTICQIIKLHAKIGENCGGHIHIGTHILGNDTNSWLNFLKLWSVYENIIFRFTNGDYLTARPKMLIYAEPMTKDFYKDYLQLKNNNSSLEEIIEKIAHKRSQAVNFYNVSRKNYDKFIRRNTIEFRCPNGTLDPVIWQNNVNLLVKLLTYSKKADFNDDIIDKRHTLNLDNYANLKWYDEIYLEQALELSDMIFNNNLDKIYFLKQYLKSFEICRKKTNYPKAKTLTKK